MGVVLQTVEGKSWRNHNHVWEPVIGSDRKALILTEPFCLIRQWMCQWRLIVMVNEQRNFALV